MSKQRNSITINIDEYEFEIVFRNYKSTNLSYVYIFIRKNHAIPYWILCCQKNNQFIIEQIFEEYDQKFIDLLKVANIIELCGAKLCLKNEILLQLI